jgi:hypothetical protein
LLADRLDIRRLFMTATQDTPQARTRASRKFHARDSARQSATWLDALDHLNTVESLMLTVLRRMESEEDWGPEQTTLMVGIEYLKRAAQSVRHDADTAAQST